MKNYLNFAVTTSPVGKELLNYSMFWNFFLAAVLFTGLIGLLYIFRMTLRLSSGYGNKIKGRIKK